MPAPEVQEGLLGVFGLSARGHHCKSSKNVNFKHESPFLNVMCYWVSPAIHSGARQCQGRHATMLPLLALKHLKEEVSFAFLS